MVITNEQVGKWLLLGIVLCSLVILISISIWQINKRFSFRKNALQQICRIALYTILWMALWVFSPMSNLFNEKIVPLLFNSTLDDGKHTVLILVLTGLLIFSFYNRIAKIIQYRFLLSADFLSPLITVLCLYCYYRFLSNEYIFVSVFQDDTRKILKVLDIPALALIFYVIPLLFQSLFKEKNIPIYDSNLFVDSPLDDIEEDEYERRKYYDSLIETLSTSLGKKGKALSIGLVNRWGEGKTSFIGFLKREFLKDSNTLFIEFNAWYSSNSTNLTLDFFQTLDHELSKHIYTGSVLRNYAKSLTNIDSPLNPFKYLPDNWIGDKSNKEYFNAINSLLNKLGKRIIVVIDDLDRLDNKEVFSVFQVIRNSANFDNMVFITPFDKEYVIHSLSEMKIHNPGEYVKKIFDVEISLPPINKYHLIRMFDVFFKESLKKLNRLDAESKKKIIYQIDQILLASERTGFDTSKYSIVGQTISDTFRNKRDLIRFVNSLIVTLRDSHGIVYILDVFILELIKNLDNGLFRKLFESKDWYNVENGSNNFLEIKVINNVVYNRMLETVLNEDLRALVDKLLRNLLALPLSNDFNEAYSFYYASNFDNYHQFNESGISKNDIDNLFS